MSDVHDRQAELQAGLGCVTDAGSDELYLFGAFKLEVARRTLYASGRPVSLSSRAFDILVLLVRNRDRIVPREELVLQVWHGLAIDPGNLGVQVSTLRRALGDMADEPTIIATVPGRGYRFIGALDANPDSNSLSATRPPKARRALLLAAGTAAVTVFMILGATAVLQRPVQTAPRLSLAVIPFADPGADSDGRAVADAITDDLTTDLAHVPGSLVIVRASTASLKDRGLTDMDIGRTLGVRYLIEGSVRALGGTLHFNVRLIETASGGVVWAWTHDWEPTHPWAAQAEAVRYMESKLAVVLPDAENARSLHKRPFDETALDLFFRAQSLLDHQDTLSTLIAAQGLLEKAIERNPDFIDALAQLGILLGRKMQVFDDETEDFDHTQARKIIQHALLLAPQDSMVNAAQGRLLSFEGQCGPAIDAYRRALDADQNNTEAMTGIANCKSLTGQPLAVIPVIERLIRIDPEGPATPRRHFMLGLSHLLLGHTDDAIKQLGAAETEDIAPPGDDPIAPSALVRLFLVAAYELAGQNDEAEGRLATYMRHWPHVSTWRIIGNFTRAQTSQAGFSRILSALEAAHMPRYVSEDVDDGVLPSRTPLLGGDFTPTPRAIPDGKLIGTEEVFRRWRGKQTIIIDVGRRNAVIPGAILGTGEESALGSRAFYATEIGKQIGNHLDRNIIVMGSGTYGIDSYNLALMLIQLGYVHVFWYRGGEESWAAHNLQSEDKRTR